MDYVGEQQMELEALEAIFMDDLQVYEGTVPDEWDVVGKVYIMTITPEDEAGEGAGDGQELQMELLWAHTPRYPEEPPCLKLQAVYGLTDGEVARCAAALHEQVEQNLGMAMIYTLISAAKEWLQNRAAQSAEDDPEVAAKKALAEAEERRVAARAHGTMVTVENFMAWRQKFEAELAAAKLKALEAAGGGKDEDKSKRMTGKAYFMQARSEINTELGSEEDLDDFEEEGLAGVDEEEEEVDEDEDLDFEDDEDDDDEDFLDELEAGRAGGS